MNFKDILYYKIWAYVTNTGMVLLGKSDPPPPPDSTGAANATAAGNLDAARAGTAANRVNQITPYGNLTYTQTPTKTIDPKAYGDAYSKWIAGGKKGAEPNANDFLSYNPDAGWSSTQTLSPDEQAKLDQNNKLALGLLGTAQKGLSGVDDALNKGFDFSALPASQINAGQTAQDAIMARLNPQFSHDEDALRTRLINQGLSPGSAAWDNEMRNFNNGKNDAYLQAGLKGIDVGQQARQQALQEQEFGRTEGLNMVNALRTGNQVQNPTFTNTPQQATTAGPDLLGAANAQYQNQLSNYNAQNAAGGNFMNGLFGIGATALGAPQGSLASRFFGG